MSTAKDTPRTGVVTTIYTPDEKVMARIRKAAKLSGKNVSRFIVAVAEREAAKVLGERHCPNCGQAIKKVAGG